MIQKKYSAVVSCGGLGTRLKEITKDIMQFLENSKLGFLNLKQTYPEYKLLHNLLDNFTVKVKQHYMNDFSP